MPSPFVWVPARRRTIPLWDIASTAPSRRLSAVLPMRWPDKPAAAARDYSIDATALLAGGDSGLTIVVNDAGGLLLATCVVFGGIASLWLAGGQPGTDAIVDLTLGTALMRRVRRFVRIAVT
jgi:hypothetical protein